MAYEHIRITRDEPVRERHPRRFIPASLRPDDARSFGQQLSVSLASAKEQIQEADIGGFDSRLLLKVNLREGAPLPELEAIGGISIVSQEDKAVVLAFATAAGLAEFEARLTTLSQSGRATREGILFSIERFGRWSPDNRTGNALRAQGFPSRTTSVLDIELWPLENQQHQAQSLGSFRQWAQQQSIEVLDTLNQPSLILLRVRSTQAQAELLLNHRDIRTVDLPPSVGINLQLLLADVNQFPEVSQPPENAPRLAVLDSGITQGHPLLSPAIGDAQGFVVPHRNASDNATAGHGTFVAGLALYGDVAEQIRQGQFIPQLQLFSGRVFNDDDIDQTEFVEKCVDEAVRYFKDSYGRIAKDTLIESDEQVVTLYAEDRIGNNHNQFYELPLPDELWSAGRRQRKISIALAYSPEVRTTRLDYKQTKLSFSLVEADSLNQVADAFTRNREQGMPERSGGRSISGEMRKPGTLQASTWTFQMAPRNGMRKLYIVITRQDANWSSQQDSDESYALSVVIQDRENANVNLHERISAIVQARIQERARVRT